jgi:hypothetical protein
MNQKPIDMSTWPADAVATVARLRAAIDDATAELGHWLTDNTDEAFEEEPDIDGVRSSLLETIANIPAI